MQSRTDHYADMLKTSGYEYLLSLWPAESSAVIKYEPGISAILGADGNMQTTYMDASQLATGKTQDWKTLWWMFQADSPNLFATVLPTTTKVDMHKLAQYMGVERIQLDYGLQLSEHLPALHTPGTAGPWTTKKDTSIDAIIVDKTAFENSKQYAHTSWAFPGIDKSKVYIPDMQHTLTQLPNHTNVPMYFADIAKQ